jgi:AraC-like DNA-binding protein
LATKGTFSVWAARPALAALVARGIDPEPALRAARLSRQALMQVENRLPHDAVELFWEQAASAAGERSFGVHVAETLPKGSCDLIDYLAAVSATVGEGVARLTHYIRLYFDHSDVHLVIEPRHARLISRAANAARQYDEFIVTTLLERSRQASGKHWFPERVMFQHAHPDDDRELRRVFGCPIRFSAPHIEICFSPRILELPHIHSDSRLLEILLRHADRELLDLGPRGDAVARASSAVTRQLTKGMPTLSSTAVALHHHPRTLQRRLAAHGVSHTTLVDDARRGLALRYIGDAGLSIAEIAYVLHFSDATAFNRAFKRWTGETALRYRKQMLAGN